MSTTKKYLQFNPSNSAIVLADHQPGVQLGEELNIPMVITSTRENLEFLVTNLPEIQKAAPKGYEKRIRRAGTLNTFHDPAFVDAIKKLNRPNLVIAGLLTDVCLFHSVVSAIEAGYQVQVAADASGTSSVLADNVIYDRLRDFGAIITTTYGVLFELYSDLSTPEGQKAEGIAAASAQAQKEAASNGAPKQNQNKTELVN